MERVNKQLLILGSLIFFVMCLGTCRLKQYGPREYESYIIDTSIVNRLMTEKQALQKQLSAKVILLEHTADSLRTIAVVNKKALLTSRHKAKELETELKALIKVADSTNLVPDSLSEITGQYIDQQNKNDSICTETINSLEGELATKDSVIEAQHEMDKSSRDMLALEAEHSHAIRLELDRQEEKANKASRQNRWLKAGIWVISGVSATLLLINVKK